MNPRDTTEPPPWLTTVVARALPRSGLTAFVPTGSAATSALVRVPRYPRSIPENVIEDPLSLDIVRNGSRSVQLAVIADRPIKDLRCRVSDLEGNDGSVLSSDRVDVRFVDYVPVVRALSEPGDLRSIEELAGDGLSGDRGPDLIGDPLASGQPLDVGAHRAQPIWLTIRAPESLQPGGYEGVISIETDGMDPYEVPLELTVESITIAGPEKSDFHLDVWFNPDAVAVEAGVDRWSTEHWDRLEPYFEELAAAGQSMIAAAIVHQPWRRPWPDGVHRPQTATGFDSLVEWRDDDGWSFSFERFDRFVSLALEHGIGPEISTYSMIQFRDPQRLTFVDGTGERVVEPVELGDDRWRSGWTAFLKAFSEHLTERGWLDRTWLAFDERPPEQLTEAIDLIDAVAPEFNDRIQVAGSADAESFADDFSVTVTDLPLASGTVEERRQRDQRTTYYTSVGNRRPNTFTVSPLIESRLTPWVVADQDLDGFLRWAFNSWPRDVYRRPVHRFMQGDEYLIYPGSDGPVPSVRWRQLRAGIEDVELLSRLGEERPERAAELAARVAPSSGSEPATPASLQAARRELIEALRS